MELHEIEKVIEELKFKIIGADDLISLYDSQIKIAELIPILHKLRETANNKSELTGNIKVLYTLLEILQGRLQDLRYKTKEENNLAHKINYNFRLAAQIVLTKETYNEIMVLAMESRSEVKGKKKELLQNKLQK